jgi:hypothetical protein
MPTNPIPTTATQACAYCGSEYPQDTHEWRERESGDYDICETCANPTSPSSAYIYSDIQDCWILRSRRCTLDDTSGYVSATWRERHCYYSEPADAWFLYEANRDDSERNDIWDYHQTNVLEVHGWPNVTPKNALCFGVELEMEHVDNSTRSGQTALLTALGGRDGGVTGVEGAYILMQDGSLDDCGVELITCPYTLDFHQKAFNWKALMGRISTIGKSGRNTINCGMHVHVNRKAISALTLGKMLAFVNSEENRRLVEHIAQRRQSGYAGLFPKKIVNGKDTESDRYDALHVSYHTIEFRIFKGNLRPDRILKNIEFCHAVVTYCRDASMVAIETYSDFLAWLSKRRGTYPNLVKFLCEQQYMTQKNIAPKYHVASQEI